MNPRKFGPYFWGTLHTACLEPVDLGVLRNFIYLFPYVLPCGKCRQSFVEILQENPFRPEDPFAWSVEVHNLVNFKLGKPRVGLQEAYRVWSTNPPETFTDFF